MERFAKMDGPNMTVQFGPNSNILQARQYWAMSNGRTDRRRFIRVIFCKTVFRISIEYPINLPHGTRILKHGRIRQRLH